MKKNLFKLIALSAIMLAFSCSTQVDEKTLIPTSSSEEAIDLFEQARNKLAADETEDALELLNQAIELDVSFALAYVYRILADGSINSYKSNIVKALENIESASPNEQVLLTVFKYSREGDGNQMKVYLDSIQKMYPEDVWVNYLLGVFNFNGTDEDLESFYTKAIELKPAFLPAYINLITHFTYGMMLDQAKEYADKYIEIRPDHADPFLKMGTIYRQQNELEKAIEQYEKAAELDPASSLTLLANCHVFQGNNEKAHELYQKSFETSKVSGLKRGVLTNIAIAYIFEGDKDKALESFEKVHEFNIKNAAKYAAVNNRFSQAFTSAIMGDFAQVDSFMLKAEAEAEMANFDETQKSNFSETKDLWTCYFASLQGDIEKAHGLVGKYMKTAKEQNLDYKVKIANFFYGIIAVKSGEFDKAVEYLNSGMQDYITWYYCGLAYQELGETEKAKEQFEKITSANLININLASVKKDAAERMKELANM